MVAADHQSASVNVWMGLSLERSATYSSTAARPTALGLATRRDFGSHVCVPPGYNVYDSRTHMSTSELPEGWVTQVKQAWMLPPFLKQPTTGFGARDLGSRR